MPFREVGSRGEGGGGPPLPQEVGVAKRELPTQEGMLIGLSDIDAQRTLWKPALGEQPATGPHRVISRSTRRAGTWRRVPGGRYRSRHPVARSPHAAANAPPGSPQQPPSG